MLRQKRARGEVRVHSNLCFPLVDIQYNYIIIQLTNTCFSEQQITIHVQVKLYVKPTCMFSLFFTSLTASVEIYNRRIEMLQQTQDYQISQLLNIFSVNDRSYKGPNLQLINKINKNQKNTNNNKILNEYNKTQFI